MSQPAIRVENLGKEYQLGLREQGYKTFRETLMDLAAAPLRRFRHLSGTSRKAEKFWALKDVSFEVEPGEIVGVIGRNGAGKSTLLKVLTRITEPTTGRAEVHGHVGSLLEVGTGFHPELTGRENVFLNGAVLGMPRSMIKRRFDEIVAFSGVEKFLDTPIKRYSSGMQVRLAFAVAAHLNPEILLIDEVLAVGDAEFQKKCLGKMSEVARCGRTVLFVSHNMGAVSQLCQKAMVLSQGHPVFFGDVTDGISYYLSSGGTAKHGYADLRDAIRWPGSKEPILTWISTHRADGTPTSHFAAGETLLIRVGYHLDRDLVAYCQMNIDDALGERLLTLRTGHSRSALDLAAGTGVIECRVDDMRPASGEYSLTVELGAERGASEWLDCVADAVRCEFQLNSYLGGAELTRSQGRFAQQSKWSRRLVPEGDSHGN